MQIRTLEKAKATGGFMGGDLLEVIVARQSFCHISSKQGGELGYARWSWVGHYWQSRDCLWWQQLWQQRLPGEYQIFNTWQKLFGNACWLFVVSGPCSSSRSSRRTFQWEVWPIPMLSSDHQSVHNNYFVDAISNVISWVIKYIHRRHYIRSPARITSFVILPITPTFMLCKYTYQQVSPLLGLPLGWLCLFPLLQLVSLSPCLLQGGYLTCSYSCW